MDGLSAFLGEMGFVMMNPKTYTIPGAHFDIELNNLGEMVEVKICNRAMGLSASKYFDKDEIRNIIKCIGEMMEE